MESELFGYKAGAFTDARKDKPGRFQLANGGTLLLDEVGDLPQTLQSKILRVLQERVFEPLGGVESVPANVRIVAATNRDLQDMSAKGEFRQDLYYRLNVVQMKLPPLRERNGDIMKLINHFLARRRVITGKDIQGLDTIAAKTLLNHDYPGNIRELQNIIEYASILCPGGLIGLEHLPEQVKPQEPPRLGQGPYDHGGNPDARGPGRRGPPPRQPQRGLPGAGRDQGHPAPPPAQGRGGRDQGIGRIIRP